MIGVNPPGHFLWSPQATDEQIDRYSRLCARDASCSSRTNDLAASMRKTAADLPGRFWGLPISRNDARIATFYSLMESTSESAPLSAPMAIDTWLSAADGDASGLWFMSLLARMAFPESFVWGELAAVSRADTSAADRYFARGPHRKDSILGNAGTEFLYGGGGLTHAFPPAPDAGEYTRVQDSDVETLLVGGTLDFATPPKFATQELLPHLRNGHQVVLAELGHSGTFWSYEPKASTRLLNTFFDSGRVDTSLYTPAKVDFTPDVTQTALGKGFAGTMIGLPVLVLVSLLLMRRRVRRRGRFGRTASVLLRSLYTIVLGLGGWFAGARRRATRVPRGAARRRGPRRRLDRRADRARRLPRLGPARPAGRGQDDRPLRLDLRRPRRRVARISRRHGSSGGRHHDRRSGTRRQPRRAQPGHRAGPGGPGPRGRIARARDAGGSPLDELTPTPCGPGARWAKMDVSTVWRAARRRRVEPMGELAQPLVAAPEAAAHKLRRDVGFLGLGFAELGSIIGAGWLFAALYASSLAGPAALISWVLGGGAMMLLALTHAELGGTYPVAAGNARFPHYAFGRLIGFTSGWVAFLGAVTVGPIMVQATLFYASNYVSSLTTVSGGRPVLTAQGYVVAAALLLAFCVINVLGVRWLAETNMIAVVWKLFVPVVTVVALLATSAHGANFTAGGGFMPYGWKGVFLALSSGGVVFACLGFEQAVQLGGESRNPGRNIPLAIIGGMVIAVGLYIALQVAFIAALDPSSLSNGWSAITLSGKAQVFGPFAGLATALGLGWLAVLIYSDAIVSPGGTGLLYTGASARLSFALGRSGFIPGPFARLTPRGTPALRDRVLVPLRPGALSPVPGLAAARRLHLRRCGRRLRDGAALARSAEAPGPDAAAPLPAAGRLDGGAGRLRGRERDPALHRLGGRLEADRRDPDRLRAPDALDC